MTHRILLLAILALCAFAAFAAGPAAVRKQVESSMLVTGSIDIERDGSVGGHRLDNPGQLPEGVVGLIEQSLPGWRFEPIVVDGKAVRARAKMSLRVVAKKLEGDNYSIGIRSASFGEEKYAEGESATSIKMTPPKYPPAAYRSGISGDVYLIVRVGRQGTVEDVVAEQVNLKVIGTEAQMQQGRKLLVLAATNAARRWTFKPPTIGDAADASHWSVRVPVSFRFEDQRDAGYGEWEAYVPGPRQTASWLGDDDRETSSDAMLAGGIYPVGTGPRLLTPLGQG